MQLRTSRSSTFDLRSKPHKTYGYPGRRVCGYCSPCTLQILAWAPVWDVPGCPYRLVTRMSPSQGEDLGLSPSTDAISVESITH